MPGSDEASVDETLHAECVDAIGFPLALKARAGGGVLIMNLTHYVDLIRHLTGTEPEWVAGTARTQPGAEVEDAIAWRP